MNSDISTHSGAYVDAMPMWAASYVGGTVRLIRDWATITRPDLGDDAHLAPKFVVPALATGKLDGVQKMADGSVRALVLFDGEFYDPSDVVDVPFSLLRVVDRDEASARHPFAEIEGRKGEVALMWASGVDVKNRLSKTTFYRYRRQLLQSHSVDICRPVDTQFASRIKRDSNE